MTRKLHACSTAMALVLAAAIPAAAQEVTWTYSDIDQDGKATGANS